MRLNKFLARAGLASRRKCDDFIKNKKVIINGKIITDYSYQVSQFDIITCDGTQIGTIPKKRVYLLNKLKGYISTSVDPRGRKTVVSLIKSEDRLFTIGRLDRDTTGTILVTNDGELANKLMHPSYQIERIYIVDTKLDIPEYQFLKLTDGIRLSDNTYVCGKINKLFKKNGLIKWRVVLHEGKNHEVKRIFLYFKSRVINLHRESFAGISADNLLPGKYRELSKQEIGRLINNSS